MFLLPMIFKTNGLNNNGISFMNSFDLKGCCNGY